MPHERRHFVRVMFATQAQLACEGALLDVRVLDVSLKGALVTLPEGSSLQQNVRCTLTLPLTSGTGHIQMEMRVAHIEGQQLGLLCLHSDLDSVTHLRRLIELQLGDPKLLERDLRELVAED